MSSSTKAKKTSRSATNSRDAGGGAAAAANQVRTAKMGASPGNAAKAPASKKPAGRASAKTRKAAAESGPDSANDDGAATGTKVKPGSAGGGGSKNLAAAAETGSAGSPAAGAVKTAEKRSAGRGNGAGKASERSELPSKAKTPSRAQASQKKTAGAKGAGAPPKTAQSRKESSAKAGKETASKTVHRPFKKGEHVVYPPHGVGRVVKIGKEKIAEMNVELLIIEFDRDKLILRIPLSKVKNAGLRKLSEKKVVQQAMETLCRRARIKRTMWSRRSQEYNAKINSGDMVAIAEVTRDLFRPQRQPEQSYSERQIYEMARDRFVQELAVIDRIEESDALEKVESTLQQAYETATAKTE